MVNTHSSDTDAEVSKFLSYILRHKPEAIRLCLDSEGWADVAALLHLAARHGKAISHEQLAQVVAQSDKKRFAFSEDGLRMRAVQGHSSNQVDIRFTPQPPPELLFHGTAERFMESIQAKGLLPGERQYVHLSPDKKTAKAVGKRHGKAVVLMVRSSDMAQDGFLFYLSENGVWLTREVPGKYIGLMGGTEDTP